MIILTDKVKNNTYDLTYMLEDFDMELPLYDLADKWTPLH